MSKMFSTFRKRQKAMMAVLGIACMIAFALSAMVTPGGGSNDRRTANDLIASSRIEDLHRDKVEQLVESRRIANAYVRELFRRLGFDMQRGYFGSDDMREVVRSYLLAKRAEQLGIEVSTKAVFDFLDAQVVFGSLKSEQFQEAFKAMEGRANEQRVVDAIRMEVLAQLLHQQFRSSVQSVSPLERWNYYRRSKIQANVEVFPYPVKNVVDAKKVSDPTEEQIAELYEKYKDQEPIPGSPEPGFRVPDRVKLQYFVFDRVKRIEAELAKITDADVRARYEEEKDQLWVSPIGPASALRNPPISRPPSKSKGAKKSATDSSKDNSGEPIEEGSERTDGDTQTNPLQTKDGAVPSTSDSERKEDGESTKEGAKTESSPPAEESSSKGTDDKGADDKGAAWTPNRSKSGVASALASPTGTLFGVLQADEPASKNAAADGQPTAETKSQPPESSTEESSTEESSTEESSADAAEETSGESDGQADSKEANSEQAPHVNADEGAAEATDAQGEPGSSLAAPTFRRAPQLFTTEYRLPPADIDDWVYTPLSNVYSIVARNLAVERFNTRTDDAVNELLTAMQKYSTARKRHKSNKQRKEPAPLDLKAMGEKHGAEFVETQLLTAFELSKQTGIGEALIMRDSPSDVRRRSANIVQFAFSPAADYLPVEAEGTNPLGASGDVYVVWRIQFEKAYTPDLADIRDQVAGQWKIMEAREPARREAESLVAKVVEADKPLADVLGAGVQSTGKFTWWVGPGGLGGAASQFSTELDEVENVIDPGDEFMEKVFQTPVGGVGFAMNEPQTVAYVFRVVEKSEIDDALQRNFMSISKGAYEQARQLEEMRLNRAWADRILNDEMGLTWATPIDEDSPPAEE